MHIPVGVQFNEIGYIMQLLVLSYQIPFIQLVIQTRFYCFKRLFLRALVDKFRDSSLFLQSTLLNEELRKLLSTGFSLKSLGGPLLR